MSQRARAKWVRLLGVALTLSVAACAHVPDDQQERRLYLDLRRIVDTRETVDWLIDRYEIEDVAPSALRSTCQVPQPTRLALDEWLTAEIDAAGGPAEELWRKKGKDLDAVDDVLTLERVRALLRYTEDNASADCPFWLEPTEDFEGVHRDSDRFVILLESSGGANLLVTPDKTSIGGFGGGRLIPAWGIGEKFTLGAGAEIGAGGIISETEGEQELTASGRAAVPVLLRYTDLSRTYDFELAATTIFTTGRLSLHPGVRAMFGTGVAAIRISRFMPVAQAQISYDYHWAVDDLPATHIILLGTRVGIDVDP